VNIINNIDVQIIIANVMLHKNLQVLFNLIALALILTTKLKAMCASRNFLRTFIIENRL
jgi:hypothetical protein